MVTPKVDVVTQSKRGSARIGAMGPGQLRALKEAYEKEVACLGRKLGNTADDSCGKRRAREDRLEDLQSRLIPLVEGAIIFQEDASGHS